MRLHVHGSDVRVHYSSINVSSRHIHHAIIELVDVGGVSMKSFKSMLCTRVSPIADNILKFVVWLWETTLQTTLLSLGGVKPPRAVLAK